MSNLYIRVKTGFYTNRKTIRLKLKLGFAAYWIPPRLWAFAAENQPDGDMSSYSAEELAELLGYTGNACSNASSTAQALLDALVDCRFLNADLTIHDWAEHNGYHETFAKRAKNAANARWEKEIEKRNRKEDIEKEIESGDKHCLTHASSMTMEIALTWLAGWKNNGADYTESEMKSAFLALSASGWMWGKNPVTDFRAALERQIQTDRQRNTKPTYANHRSTAPDRNAGTYNDKPLSDAAKSKVR